MRSTEAIDKFEMMGQKLIETVGGYLPKIAGALLILFIGWIVALVVSAVVRGVLRKISLNKMLGKWVTTKPESMDIEGLTAKIVFYVILLFVLMGVFVSLGLNQVSQPINQLLIQVFEFLPRLIGAAVLILVTWVIAVIVKNVLTRVFDSTQLDEKLAEKAGLKEGDSMGLSKNISEVAFWLIFLLFLPAILGALGAQGVLTPIQSMLDKILSFLPNLFSAAIILLVGWFVARIVQKIVSSLLSAAGINKLAENFGLTKVLGKKELSEIFGFLLYVLILIPIAIAALEALQLETLTRPAANMLNTLLGAVPALFSASIILFISYLLARIVSTLITEALGGLGFDKLPMMLGLKSEETEDGRKKPSEIAGFIVIVYIMFFATLEACGQLGFTSLTSLLIEFLGFSTNVLLGVITLAIGLYIANLVAKIISDTGIQKSSFLATAARVVILVLAGTMALHQIGVADEIVNLSFGLLVGAIAVAVALSFGLGCREIAARELDDWITKFKSNK